MEPNIEIDSEIQILYVNYKEYLARKIKLVCSKVGFSYDNIKWIIFDPKISNVYGNKPNQIQKIFIGRQGQDYGACNLKDKIWISTLAIQKELIENSTLAKMNTMLNGTTQKKEDFLANVILDEIAHIYTKSNHGDKKYDQELNRIKDLYYNDIISRMLKVKSKK